MRTILVRKTGKRKVQGHNSSWLCIAYEFLWHTYVQRLDGRQCIALVESRNDEDGLSRAQIPRVRPHSFVRPFLWLRSWHKCNEEHDVCCPTLTTLSEAQSKRPPQTSQNLNRQCLNTFEYFSCAVTGVWRGVGPFFQHLNMIQISDAQVLVGLGTDPIWRKVAVKLGNDNKQLFSQLLQWESSVQMPFEWQWSAESRNDREQNGDLIQGSVSNANPSALHNGMGSPGLCFQMAKVSSLILCVFVFSFKKLSREIWIISYEKCECCSQWQWEPGQGKACNVSLLFSCPWKTMSAQRVLTCFRMTLLFSDAAQVWVD